MTACLGGICFCGFSAGGNLVGGVCLTGLRAAVPCDGVLLELAGCGLSLAVPASELATEPVSLPKRLGFPPRERTSSFFMCVSTSYPLSGSRPFHGSSSDSCSCLALLSASFSSVGGAFGPLEGVETALYLCASGSAILLVVPIGTGGTGDAFELEDAAVEFDFHGGTGVDVRDGGASVRVLSLIHI